MTQYHAELAAGRWLTLSLVEQMANIGSEVGRAFQWKVKGNRDYACKAFERALELFDLTLADAKNRERLKEVARAREVFTDCYSEAGRYSTTEASWNKYFLQFAIAARQTAR